MTGIWDIVCKGSDGYKLDIVVYIPENYSCTDNLA